MAPRNTIKAISSKTQSAMGGLGIQRSRYRRQRKAVEVPSSFTSIMQPDRGLFQQVRNRSPFLRIRSLPC